MEAIRDIIQRSQNLPTDSDSSLVVPELEDLRVEEMVNEESVEL